MEQKILEFGKKLALAKNVLLINHIRMDPDCFGSLTAFYLILKKMDYNVVATNDENNPSGFSFLGADHIIEPGIDIKSFQPDLIISFDAASLAQLGETYKKNEKIFQNTDFVVFDHHITNHGFGSLNIIDVTSSSTCELLFHTLETIGLDIHIDKHIATLLTAGIHTDTNIFYNANTTPRTLKIAAKLMEYGADFRLPMFEFFKKKEFNKTKLWGESLRNIKQSESKKVVWGLISKEIFEKTHTTDKDTSGLINEFLANIEGCEVSFLLYPLDKGGIKASFRSSGYDVASICESFGGGGHKQAAGFTLFESMEEVEQKILDKLKDLY